MSSYILVVPIEITSPNLKAVSQLKTTYLWPDQVVLRFCWSLRKSFGKSCHVMVDKRHLSLSWHKHTLQTSGNGITTGHCLPGGIGPSLCRYQMFAWQWLALPIARTTKYWPRVQPYFCQTNSKIIFTMYDFISTSRCRSRMVCGNLIESTNRCRHQPTLSPGNYGCLNHPWISCFSLAKEILIEQSEPTSGL